MDNNKKTIYKGTFLWSFISLFLILGIIIGGAIALYYFKGRNLNSSHIASTEKLIGLQFSSKERKMMQSGLQKQLNQFKSLHQITIDNSISPALQFNPVVQGIKSARESSPYVFSPDPNINIPENKEELAFFPVSKLASLIQSRKLSSMELTRLYLNRLKKFGPKLKCVITLTEELALKQAKKADAEIASGKYRGPLHGIPWGAKDLFSVKGYKTTWGALPFKHQIIDIDATIVKRLEKAGAVLVAKLSMGALAMGDYWYEGKTRSPWNIEKGSSGSSAGPGSATAGGLVGFSIGTETQGSIISPSLRCSISGLRPTYGMVSRYGAMALSWSMDKIGPMGRTVEDCALVFNAIYGPDGKDLTISNIPFNWDPDLPLEDIKVGYLKKAFEGDYKGRDKDQAVLNVLRSMGIELKPIDLPDIPLSAMSFILIAEAAAAFDDLTRSNKDDVLVRQNKGAWPNIFRQARFIPAVEYIQANRLRSIFMNQMAEKLKACDVFVAPCYREGILLATNLSGHPAVVVPTSFPNKKGETSGITFIGNLYEEAKTLRLAHAYQEATLYHKAHPDLN